MTVELEGDADHAEVWIFGFGSLIYKAGRQRWTLPPALFSMCAAPISQARITEVCATLQAQGSSIRSVLRATSKTTGGCSGRAAQITGIAPDHALSGCIMSVLMG